MNIKIHSSELNRMMKTISQCVDEKFDKFSNIEICHENNLLTIRGTNGSDSAQYKLWGNGIALPCAVDVLGRIAEEIRSEGRPD